MRVRIEKVIYPGKRLARHDGKVILTDDGLPGEEIEIRPIRDRKNYTEAETVKILSPSPDRILPKCDHYCICSPYQNMAYGLQIRIKEGQIREIFSHNLKIEPEDIVFRAAENIWGYRNKIDVRLVWEDAPYFAYNFPKSSDRFKKIDKCFLASRNINHILGRILEIIFQNRLGAIRNVVVKESVNSGRLLLALFCEYPKLPKNIHDILDSALKNSPIAGIVSVDRATYTCQTLMGADYIEESLCGRLFHIGALSFFQINIPMLELLIEDINDYLILNGSETIADLYCGVGTFGIVFAPRARKVIGVESSSDNIYFLNKNIRLNNLNNFAVEKCDALEWLSRQADSNIDILLVDPPRGGLGRKTCENILKRRFNRLLYISCDPATLARDLRELLSGYILKRVFIYDFFPQTQRIEVFSIMELKK